MGIWQHFLATVRTRACFLSLAQSKLGLCSANHRPGYWSNLPCDWPSTASAYSEQETENEPWSHQTGSACSIDQWSTKDHFHVYNFAPAFPKFLYCGRACQALPHETKFSTLQWRHDGHDSVSNHQPHDCLLNCLFRHRSKKICTNGQ